MLHDGVRETEDAATVGGAGGKATHPTSRIGHERHFRSKVPFRQIRFRRIVLSGTFESHPFATSTWSPRRLLRLPRTQRLGYCPTLPTLLGTTLGVVVPGAERAVLALVSAPAGLQLT